MLLLKHIHCFSKKKKKTIVDRNRLGLEPFVEYKRLPGCLEMLQQLFFNVFLFGNIKK
jgi:hypothetical protein